MPWTYVSGHILAHIFHSLLGFSPIVCSVSSPLISFSYGHAPWENNTHLLFCSLTFAHFELTISHHYLAWPSSGFSALSLFSSGHFPVTLPRFSSYHLSPFPPFSCCSTLAVGVSPGHTWDPLGLLTHLSFSHRFIYSDIHLFHWFLLRCSCVDRHSAVG